MTNLCLIAIDCGIEQKLNKCSIDDTEHGDGEMFVAWDPIADTNQGITGPRNASTAASDEVKERACGEEVPARRTRLAAPAPQPNFPFSLD